MTTAEFILCACGVLGLIFTVIAWVYGFGRMSEKWKTTDDRIDALNTRIDGLEKDVKEVGEIKQQLKAHADLTNSKFEGIAQQSRDGFERVATEIRAFDRLVSSQLEEIKHRLREPAPH